MEDDRTINGVQLVAILRQYHMEINGHRFFIYERIVNGDVLLEKYHPSHRYVFKTIEDAVVWAQHDAAT